MKQSILFLALAALVAFGCNQSPSTAPTMINDPGHRSSSSSGGTVGGVVLTCFDTAIADTYSYPVTGASGGNGSWSYSSTGAATWTANSSTTNQNANIFFTVTQKRYTNTQNICTGAITTTLASTSTVTSTVYLSRDGGITWRSVGNSSPRQSNGNNPGGNGSGLGKFTVGTYTILMDNDANISNGTVGSFTLIQH
jgi:hypothetical protein